MWDKLSFSHGVHPPEHKDQSSGVPIRRMPFPEEIVLPLRQHAGKPARAIVKVGDRVERGDKIAEADGFVSVPIHSSAAGEVVGIGWWPHPDGSMAEAVRIKVEKFSPQIPRPRVIPRWEGLDPKQVASLRALLDNQQAAALPIFQSPGANAIELSDAVRTTMERLAGEFPPGVDWQIAPTTSRPSARSRFAMA